MVTIEISKVDARRLCVLLLGDKREYREGIKELEKLKEADPEQKIGKRKQTPEEAILTTELMIVTIDRILNQIHEK